MLNVCCSGWALCVFQYRNTNSEDAGKQWHHGTRCICCLSRKQLGMGRFLLQLPLCVRGSEHSGCQVWGATVLLSCDFFSLNHIWSCCKHLKFFDVLKHVICLKIPPKFHVRWPACHTCEPLFCVFQLCHLQTTRTSRKDQAWKIYSFFFIVIQLQLYAFSPHEDLFFRATSVRYERCLW